MIARWPNREVAMLNQQLFSRMDGFTGPGIFLAAGAGEPAASPAKPPILIVDDDDQVRSITARMLRYEGFEVLESDSAKDALRKIERQPGIKVALVDIVMPNMGGTTLAAKIAAESPGCHVILMTGYPNDPIVVKGSRYPVLIKPFAVGQVVQEIRSALGDSRQ